MEEQRGGGVEEQRGGGVVAEKWEVRKREKRTVLIDNRYYI